MSYSVYRGKDKVDGAFQITSFVGNNGIMIGSIIGAIGQIGTSIYGAARSSQLNRQANDMLERQMSGARSYYEGKLAEDYMNRSDVQSVLQKQRELLDEQYKRARATNVVAGGTDESLALQKQAANDSLADTMSDIAASASSYRDSLERQYRDEMNSYTSTQRSLLQSQANAVAQAASQVGSAFANAGIGVDSLYSMKKKEA